jgi:hypothetical protein
MSTTPEFPTPEGTLAFWCSHPHADWATNGEGYNFGEFTAQGMTMSATKHPDRTVTITLTSPLGRAFNFRQPIPPCRADGAMLVLITWTPLVITLRLNNKDMEVRPLGN